MVGEPTSKTTRGEEHDPALEALFAQVLQRWDDEKTHQAALAYALDREKLAELAGFYRRQSDDPARAALVKRRLDAIVLAATHLLTARVGPLGRAETKKRRVPVVVTATAFVLMMGLLTLVAWGMLHPR